MLKYIWSFPNWATAHCVRSSSNRPLLKRSGSIQLPSFTRYTGSFNAMVIRPDLSMSLIRTYALRRLILICFAGGLIDLKSCKRFITPGISFMSSKFSSIGSIFVSFLCVSNFARIISRKKFWDLTSGARFDAIVVFGVEFFRFYTASVCGSNGIVELKKYAGLSKSSKVSFTNNLVCLLATSLEKKLR